MTEAEQAQLARAVDGARMAQAQSARLLVLAARELDAIETDGPRGDRSARLLRIAATVESAAQGHRRASDFLQEQARRYGIDLEDG